VTFVGIFAHAAFVPLFLWIGAPMMAAFNVGSVSAWVIARVVNRRGHVRVATAIIVLEVLAHAALATFYVGWRSGFHYYVIPLLPFVIFNDQLRPRIVVAASSGILVAYVVLRIVAPEVGAVTAGALVMRAIEALNLVVPFLALALVSGYFRSASVDIEHRMEVLAMTDPLTALPNRRQMLDLLDRARAQVARGGEPFGVILGDIDGFKHINDTRGHEAGDHVLRTIATILRNRSRAQDVAARWGGEEFLFLLPRTDLSGAAVLAEQLRDAVARAEITFLGEPVRVTMTFGVSTFAPNRSVDDAVRLADAALYAGKGDGKNRVILETATALS
jgi:diguanylate cyclase (GGDEF)-like protein